MTERERRVEKMREILFRGKTLEYSNGNIKREWVYGSYYKDDTGDCIKELPSAVSTPTHFIDVETLGQYTGLTDKNGTKIFEGDVLEVVIGAGGSHEYKTRGVVIADEWNCSCCYGVYGFSTDSINGYETLDLRNYDRSVVIGNIHDNPELLKESEK